MASIMTSMPLLGESRPKVRITALPPKPSLALAAVGRDERGVGDAVRNDLDLIRRPRHIPLRSRSRAFSAMTMTLDEASTILFSTLALHRSGFGKNRVQRRDDRHAQSRQQRQDVIARVAAENAELMLQA